MEEWGNHEDLWCRKTCISRFISCYLWPCRSGSGLDQISFKRQFHNVPFNYFTNQGLETGYYLEDRGVNVIIITSDKNGYHHLWPKHIPLYRKYQRSVLNLSVCYVAMKSNFTDAFTQCLTFSIAASILDHCLSAPLRLTRWQVYWVIKFERQEHCATTRLFGSGPSFSGGWNEHITPAQHLNFPSLSSPPVWPTDWAQFLCCTVFTEWLVSTLKMVSYTGHPHVDAAKDLRCFLNKTLFVKPVCENHDLNNSLISGDILWTKFILHHADVSNMKLETSGGYKN